LEIEPALRSLWSRLSIGTLRFRAVTKGSGMRDAKTGSSQFPHDP
jgi:hypothetical protein